MIVLSLCDGMSCGHLALDRAGIQVDKYYAAEIKDIAIKVTQDNYPDTIQIGDVNKISYIEGVLHTEKEDFSTPIDLVMFGSPCQSFSVAMKTEGRIGLEDKERSGLFLECYRILKEVNPQYFFMENVASMRNDDKDVITKLMGVKPLKINSQIVSPALRNRYYWTNIPYTPIKEKLISLQEILTSGYTDRKKARSLLASDSRPLATPVKMFHRYYAKRFGTLIFKSKEHYDDCVKYYNSHYAGMNAREIPTNETDIFNGVRMLNQEELEACQTVPRGYTKCLSRDDAANILGDGWTIDVIAGIFKGLKQE